MSQSQMQRENKQLGQFFTPPEVARTLTRWVIRSGADILLDPSCGTGEFLVCHPGSVGIELSERVCQQARDQARDAQIIQEDFFEWALTTKQRFDAAIGNPPFI